jgi:Mrp family chromosome partitioning ATPase
MSRNFELLQRLGMEEQFVSRTPAEPVRRPVAVPEVVRRAAVVSSDPHAAGIVQRLFLAPDGAAPAAVSFLSMERKTGDTLCARVAENLASQVSGWVCVVDADFAHPALHDYFLLKNERGLGDALADTQPITAFLRRIEGTQLSILTTGRGGSPLAAGERLSERIRELREQFDYVLLRAPLGRAANEACFYGRLTGSAVLVLQANATRRDAAARLKFALEQNGVSVLGAVLNDRTFPIPQSLYSKLF